MMLILTWKVKKRTGGQRSPRIYARVPSMMPWSAIVMYSFVSAVSDRHAVEAVAPLLFPVYITDVFIVDFLIDFLIAFLIDVPIDFLIDFFIDFLIVFSPIVH